MEFFARLPERTTGGREKGVQEKSPAPGTKKTEPKKFL